MNKPDQIVLTGQRVHNPDTGHAIQLDLSCGSPQLVLYLVWTVGTYKNGHPMFDLRAVTTDSVKAKMYVKMLKRDKKDLGEGWYRIHVEPRVANHLYGESMYAYREATGRLEGSPNAD